MRKLLLAGVLSVVTAFAASAQMPKYDVEAFCQPAVTKDCVENQYTARMVANTLWPNISPEARAECVKTDKWGDYEFLAICVGSHYHNN